MRRGGERMRRGEGGGGVLLNDRFSVKHHSSQKKGWRKGGYLLTSLAGAGVIHL